MAQSVGSRSSGGGYKFTWRGATVRREVDDNVQRAMEQLQKDILAYLHSTLHVYTGQMNAMAFAEIKVETGGKRTLVAGSDAPHTLFHETRYHPQLRETLDEFAPRVSEYMRAAFK